jgi:hypothetical protein
MRAKFDCLQFVETKKMKQVRIILQRIFINTGNSISWHLRCVASTSSPVQLAAVVSLGNKRSIFKVLSVCVFLFSFFISSCTSKQKPPQDYELAASWADMSIYIAKNTPANSPTFASRGFGYIGLTMYEAVVNGYTEYQSVASQLNGLGNLPAPEKNLEYNWQLSLNAAQAEILRNIYIQTSDLNKTKLIHSNSTL